MIRPEKVIVHLLKDGKVFDTQTLTKANDWRFTWTDLDAACEWEVIEGEVKGYTVTIARSGVTFTITNSYSAPTVGNNLSIQKRITGDQLNKAGNFKFLFTAKDASNPMPPEEQLIK